MGRIIEGTEDLYELLNTGLSFKCELCEGIGDHLCVPLLVKCCDVTDDLLEVLESYVEIYRGFEESWEDDVDG